MRGKGRGMARKLRLVYPGALYHVVNRGNYRRGLYESVGAAKAAKPTGSGRFLLERGLDWRRKEGQG